MLMLGLLADLLRAVAPLRSILRTCRCTVVLALLLLLLLLMPRLHTLLLMLGIDTGPWLWLCVLLLGKIDQHWLGLRFAAISTRLATARVVPLKPRQ